MMALDKNTTLNNMPYSVWDKVKSELQENGNWKTVAVNIMKFYGEHSVSMADIRMMEQMDSPAESLLKLLVVKNFSVEDLQRIFWESELFEILNLLVTNDRMKIKFPTQERYELQLDQLFELPVIAYGSPYPEFQWYWNNRVLEEQKSSKLRISCFRKCDVGSYMCRIRQTIEGKVEEQWSCEFSLNLSKSPPVILPGKNLRDMELETGENLLMEFGVTGEPEPEYTWYKNGTEILRSPFNIFKISGVGMRNAGTYFCKAENSEGFCHSREITVTVSPPCSAPDIPEIIIRPRALSAYAFGDTLDMAFKVHCCHEVIFSCFINDKSLGDLDNQRSTFTSDTSDNYFHAFHLHYEVNKEDWMRGNMGPVVIQFKAHSNGHFVESSVRFQIKKNSTPKNFTARNKFALLVAITDYSTDGLLSPIKDTEALANKLIGLGFRCMICRNLTKMEFQDIVCFFCKFLQPGDYVAFYYAGHGFHCNGVDYMIPLYAKGQQMGCEQTGPQEDSCITTREVINKFQGSDPALIFILHDSCRTTHPQSYNFKVPDKIAKSNTYSIYATSENYTAFEVQNASSLLMEVLLKLITEPIPVNELGSQFLYAFDHNAVEDLVSESQRPIIASDLPCARSLKDPCTPHPNDKNTVLADWEKFSNVGGTIHHQVKVDDAVLEVSVKCKQEGSPKVISNIIDVIISIGLEKLGGVKSIKEKGLEVCITQDHCDKEIIREVTGTVIKFQIFDLQALNDDLCLTLQFMKKENIVGVQKFNLGLPSLCNIRNSLRNNLN